LTIKTKGSITLKKITALVLTLALIITLSISAFAATSYNWEKSFNEGEHTIYADGTIRAADTFGAINSAMTGNDLSIYLACRYELNGNSTVMNRSASSDRYYAEVEYDAPTGGVMEQARYLYEAQVYTSAGEKDFSADSGTLIWPG